MLQVVLFQLGEGNKTLHHSLILDVDLTESKSKINSCAYTSAVALRVPDELVYHAPLGVVRFTGGIKMDVFLVELSVVHVRFLHDLEKENRSDCQALNAALSQNIVLQGQRGITLHGSGTSKTSILKSCSSIT